MMVLRRALLIAAALLASACFDPDLSGPGRFACPDGECPDGFSCQLNPGGRRLCVRDSSGDSGSTDGSSASKGDGRHASGKDGS